MLKFIDRFIPRYAHLPLASCMLTLILTYSVTMLIDVKDFVDISLPIDHIIPVRPEWVLVYILSYVYWALAYIAVARESRAHCRRIIGADFIAKLVAMAFFVLMPVTIERPEITGSGLFDMGLKFIYAMDEPRNLFPSMHCLYSWIAAREFMKLEKYGRLLKWCAVIFSVMVFLSTLFTRQHYILDIFGGIAAAEIGMLALRLIEKYRKRGV